jgi:tetratricopeptide (TPR) repeat protein
MSPEQASGDRQVGPLSDVYSLACVMFEMLTGEAPYTGATARAIMTKRMTDPVPSPRRLRASIAPSMDREVMRALSPIPADRHPSAMEFSRAVAGATAPVPAGRRLTSRHVLSGVGVMAVAALTAFVATRPDTEPTESPTNAGSGAPSGGPASLAYSLLAQRTPAAGIQAFGLFTAALARGDSAEGLAGLAYVFTLFADWGWDFPGSPSPAQLRARALEASQQAIAADSMSANAWRSRAYILSINDPYRLQGALAAFERSLRLDSLNSEGWYQYGQALMQLGQDSAAAAAYRRAFALDPNRPMALMSLSALSLNAGRVDEAKRIIDSAVAASNTVTSPYVRVVRGRIHMRNGDMRAARDEAELALAMDTVYTIPARSLMAAVRWAEGDTAGAMAEIARMRSDAGSETISPTTARYIASALVAVGRSDDAVTFIERARPRGAYLWFYLQSPDFAPLESNRRFQAVVREADPRR